jgi:hypothetical protein
MLDTLMNKQKNTLRGGARKGAGRKPKYGEKTITVAFRIPASKKGEVEKAVKKVIGPPPADDEIDAYI